MPRQWSVKTTSGIISDLDGEDRDPDHDSGREVPCLSVSGMWRSSGKQSVPRFNPLRVGGLNGV